MDKILHHQGWWLSHYLSGLSTSFDHPRWLLAGFLNHQQGIQVKSPPVRENVGLVSCEDVLGFKNSTAFSPPASSIWGSQHHVFFFLGSFTPRFLVFWMKLRGRSWKRFLRSMSWASEVMTSTPQLCLWFSVFGCLNVLSTMVTSSPRCPCFLCFLEPYGKIAIKDLKGLPPIKETNIHVCHLVGVYVVGIIARKRRWGAADRFGT